jgi:uncharacterized membrane protein
MPSDTNLNICIVVSLLCWGAWGIFDKLALRYAPFSIVMAGLFTLSIPATAIALVMLNIYEPGWSISSEIYFWSILGFASYGIAMICYLRAMNLSEASYVLGATASYPVVLQFLSNFFLQEALVPTRLGGSLLVAAGVFAISASGQSEETEILQPQKKRNLILLVIAATLLWGVWGIFDKKAIDAGGPLIAFYLHSVYEVIALIPLAIIVYKKDRKYLNQGWKLWTPVACSGLCINIGSASYMFALSMATASYVIVITGCYPMIMYLLALLVLKEKCNYVRLLGIVLVTAGGIITHTTEGL